MGPYQRNDYDIGSFTDFRSVRACNTYAAGHVNLLEFKCNNFNSLFQAVTELENSNFGGKSSELLVQCRFTKKFDFS